MSTKERTTKIAEMQVRYARERAEEQAVLDAAPEPPYVKRERAISGAQGMTETAISRCPFCGGAAALNGLGYCGPADCYDVQVECDDCGARSATLIVDQSLPNVAEQERDIAAEAVSAWNRRAS